MPLNIRRPFFMVVMMSVLVTVLSITFTTNSAVAASPGDDGPKVVLTPLPDAEQPPDVVAPMAICPTCTCTLQVNQPHNSGHVAGNINVTANVTCTHAQPRVRVTVDLLKDDFWAWTQYAPRGDKTVNNRSYVSTNSAGGCTDGSYMGHGSGYYDAANGTKFGGSADSAVREISC